MKKRNVFLKGKGIYILWILTLLYPIVYLYFYHLKLAVPIILKYSTRVTRFLDITLLVIYFLVFSICLVKFKQYKNISISNYSLLVHSI